MEKFKYIFGPVPSRRMGRSIGISPIKQGHCNYSCIYCQLGRTRKMTNTIENYFDYKDILEEFKEYIEENINYDVVTIVGEGEPLLYQDIDKLIKGLKELTKKPVAVITNGGLLSRSEVREKLMEADIVLPSIDAIDETGYKKINRPHGSIGLEKSMEGLLEFSREYKGQLWIETMLIKDINDNLEFYRGLREILRDMNYHRLYINTPVRPPAESFVEEPSEESVELAMEVLGGISINKLASDGFFSEVKDDYEAVINIIKRHPMNQFEIRSFLESRKNQDIEGFFERINGDDNIEIVNYKNYISYRFK